MKLRSVLVLAVLVLSLLGVVTAQVVPTVIDIDVKPGSDVNPINVKSHGKTPIALLCSATFDPATVVVSSLLAGSGAVPSHCALEDVNADLCIDLVCQFPTQDLGVVCGDTDLTVTGVLDDDTPITGTDVIRTVPCRP